MKKESALIIIAVVVIVIIIAGLTLNYSKTPSSFGKTDVTISQVGDFVLYLPLYVAKDKGFFESEGLNVKITSSGGDDKSFASVLSGEAQFAQGDPTFVAISKEKGGPGKAIALVVNKAPFWFVSTKNITINSASDFKGKKLVTYLAPSTAYTLTVKLAQDKGLEVNRDFTIIQSQFGSELGPLFSGEADATLTIPPTVQEAVDKGAKVVFSYPDAFGDMAVTGLTTTDKFIEDNPEIVQKTVNAYQKATTYIYNNPEEAIDVAVKRFPNLNKQSIRDAVQLSINDEVWPRSVTIGESSWNKAIQIRVQVGDIKNAPAFEDVVDNTFAQKTS
jgi:NitT/TauT family transport system substrate-binding protein